MQNSLNKQTVLSFYKNVIANRDETAIPFFIHPDYIQHSPQLKDGLPGLQEAILALKKMPVQKQEQSPVKLVIASDDLVAMYMVINMMGKTMAVADLFRLQDGLIAEHWDAAQELQLEPVTKDLIVQEEGGHHSSLNFAVLLSLLQYENRDVHHVVIDNNYALVQSSGSKNGLPFVFYEFLLLDGKQIKKRFAIEQEIPAVSANKNGMI